MTLAHHQQRGSDRTNVATTSTDVDCLIAFDSILASLRPLQDLTKNWEVDISRCLEDYLQELHEIDQDFFSSSNGCTLNFSEAALVVQNSSHVYGRKVDFLYKLVYNQLEELKSQRTCEGSATRNLSKKNNNVQPELDSFVHHDPNLEFLPLEAVLPIVDRNTNFRKCGINVPCEDTLIETTDYVHRWQNPLLQDASTTKLSLRGLTEQGSLCTTSDLTSINHSITEARKALVGALDCKTLRLAFGACCMTESGIMLVPGTVSTIDDLYRGTSSMENIVTEEISDTALVFETPQDFYCDDNDDMFSQFRQDGRDDPLETTSHCEIKQHQIANKSQFPQSVAVQERRIDDWKMICPHSRDSCMLRPLSVGKTFLLPPGLYCPPSEYVKQTFSQHVEQNQIPLKCKKSAISTTGRATAAFDIAMARKRHISDDIDDSPLGRADKRDSIFLPFKGLLFGDEFCYLMEGITKQKRSEFRRHKKLLHRRSLENVFEPSTKSEEMANSNGDFRERHDIDIDIDATHDFINGNDHSDDEDEGYGGFEINTYSHLGDDDKSDGSSDSFAALCRAHAQKLHRGAARYAMETSLTHRINLWKNKLEPILHEQTDRKPFDIHVYGESMIAMIQNESKETETHQTVDFRSISGTYPPYEVSRVFLTSLILCNAGKIVYEDVEERMTPSCPLKLRLRKLD